VLEREQHPVFYMLTVWLLTTRTRVAPDFGSGSGKSKIRPFFPNPAPAKFLAGFGRIWETPVQLQCIQLIKDKTNEADLSSDVFAILIRFTCSYSIVISNKPWKQNWCFYSF